MCQFHCQGRESRLTVVHLCLWWTRTTINACVCLCLFGFSVLTGTAWLDLQLACHHVWLKQKAAVSQQMLIGCLDVEVVAIGRLVCKVRPGNPTYLNSSKVAVQKSYITGILIISFSFLCFVCFIILWRLDYLSSQWHHKTLPCIIPFTSPSVWLKSFRVLHR